MTANYEFALIGETEATDSTSYSIQLNFTYADFAEYFITAKLRSFTNTVDDHAIVTGMVLNNGTIPTINAMYAGGYYGGQPTGQGTGSGTWFGGTSNAAFQPFRISDNNSAYGTGRWSICHWQIASQPNNGGYWPWVGQCMVPQTDGRIGVWGAVQAGNHTYSSNHGGLYIKSDSYPFVAGSKLTVWGHGHV
tara:strand:+ start:454 stop:1029 length:576 start_codon:yes stop_codon:yes gene_type:complete